MTNLWNDLRYAMRQLHKAPGFTVTAVVTLALGIGATTAIFSIFQQVLLRTLPVPDPQHLTMLRATGPRAGSISDYGDETYYFSVPMFHDLERQSGKLFSNMAASGPFSAPMRSNAGSQDVQGEFVTGEYFITLGIRPALGRMIEPADDSTRGGNAVVVLSYSEWQKIFGGSPAALNQTVDINAHPFTVVGVAPAGFAGLNQQMPAQIFVPMSMEPILPTHKQSWLEKHNATWINIVTRLRPAVKRQRAEVELNPLWYSLRKNELPIMGNSPRFVHAYMQTHLFLASGVQGLPFLQQELGPRVEILMAMATLVLLIACVNLANLLLVRGTVRAKEIAVRAALGASRTRLRTWILIEALLLTLLGGTAGIALGLLAVSPLTAGILGDGAKVTLVSSRLDLHLLLFGFAAMVLTGLLSCLPSMFLTTRPDLTRVLHEGTTQNSKGSGRLRIAFTTVQIMLGFVLLVGASLLTRTLYNLRNVDLGMRTDHVIQFFTDARSIGTKPGQAPALLQQVADAIRREPGIDRVGFSSVGLMAGNRTGGNITISGYKPREQEDMSPDANVVSPNFFKTLEVPLMAGRFLTDSDQAGAPKVAVINDVFAQHYFGSTGRALGHMFCFGSGKTSMPDITIVGVVRSTRSVELHDKPLATLYVPYAQSDKSSAYYYVRTAMAPDVATQEIRHAVQTVNRVLPLDDLEMLNEQIAGSIATPRLLALLSIGFGLLAASLAAVGLYGVLAYSIAQRTREIGIRMALGADRVCVVQLVVRQVEAMALVAILFGIPLSLLLSRYLRDELFHVAYNDPWSFLLAGLVSIAATAGAAYVPARRAASVDPMQALRSE
jgi:putative ABC transport system permease protein